MKHHEPGPVRGYMTPPTPLPQDVGGKSYTMQSHRDSTDINKIMAKYVNRGVIDHINQNEPEYGFATECDFREAMELIIKAQDMFDDLPSEVRLKFQNDPAEFLGFVENPDNIDELRSMGLVEDGAPTPLSGGPSQSTMNTYEDDQGDE